MNNLSRFFTYLVDHWKITGIVLVAGALVLASILRILTPPIPVQQTNTWNTITPGFTKRADIISRWGQPLRSTPTDLGTRLDYPSDYRVKSNEVIVDEAGVVRFMKEAVPVDNNEVIDNYIQKFGPPDLDVFAQQQGDTARAYVFLDEGVVVVAQIYGGAVIEKWYFEPATEETFLERWGSLVRTEERGPENVGFQD